MEDVVLVGIDGSPAASRALEVAITEACVRSWPLHLISVFAPSLVIDPTVGSVYAGAQQHESTMLLEEAAEPAIRRGLEVSTRIESGEAHRVLARHSAQAGLVVVGKHGRHTVSDRVLGGVSSWLAAHANCPVLITAPAREGRPSEPAVAADDNDYGGSIVAAVDGKAQQCTTVRAAAQMARLHSKPLVIVLVRGTSGDDRVLSGTETMLEQLLQAARQEHPDLVVKWQVRPGRAAKALIGISHSADMLVLGTRGHSGLTGLVLGSVSQAVLLGGTSPVMVVPQP
ncbi:universal stress protein [Arthrobacter castelli]|uniref:universal stress protein n=1 Tax=Arthrobacter castelli TaxID=271431 RepID=UPI0003F58618|nr:universal stress protein [Arthrobacter castelli]